MNTEVNNQETKQPIDVWHEQFQALMQEARNQQLFAPDILFVLQRASNEIQHQFNSILFTHEHKTNQDKGEE
jgi:hypothetical protein